MTTISDRIRGRELTNAKFAEIVDDLYDPRGGYTRDELAQFVADRLTSTGVDADRVESARSHYVRTGGGIGGLHTLAESCWCEPVSALDGHRNEDGSQPEFAATDQDPVGPDGYLVEAVAR